MNYQPFYHQITILFTATKDMDEGVVLKAIRNGLRPLAHRTKKPGILMNTITTDFMDSEPGDPADLI